MSRLVKRLEVPSNVRSSPAICPSAILIYEDRVECEGGKGGTWYFERYKGVAFFKASVNCAYAGVRFVNESNAVNFPKSGTELLNDGERINFCSGAFSYSASNAFAQSACEEIKKAFNRYNHVDESAEISMDALIAEAPREEGNQKALRTIAAIGLFVYAFGFFYNIIDTFYEIGFNAQLIINIVVWVFGGCGMALLGLATLRVNSVLGGYHKLASFILVIAFAMNLIGLLINQQSIEFGLLYLMGFLAMLLMVLCANSGNPAYLYIALLIFGYLFIRQMMSLLEYTSFENISFAFSSLRFVISELSVILFCVWFGISKGIFKRKIDMKKFAIAAAVFLVLFFGAMLVTDWKGAFSSGSSYSSSSGSVTCPVCGRTFDKGSSDAHSIARSHMCTNCRNNLDWASKAKEAEKDYDYNY